MRAGKTFGMLLAVAAFLAPAGRRPQRRCKRQTLGLSQRSNPGARSYPQLASTRRGTSLDATSPLV
jgi:hypothetical protein